MAEKKETTPAPKLNVFGRPSEYDPAYHLTQIRLYLDNPDTTVTVRNYKTDTVKDEYLYKQVRIPTIEGLASFLKIHRATVYRWSESYPDFCDMIEELQAQQAKILLEYGLVGIFNSTITKLMLTKHGYKDATDLTTNGKDIVPENQTAANAAIASFLTKKNGKSNDTGNTSE